MSTLETWATLLRQALSYDSAPEVTLHLARIHVVVWSEAALPFVRATAMRLGIPEDILQIVRPLAFLNPHPGDDPRNAQARDDFVKDQIQPLGSDAALFVAGMPPIVAGNPNVLVLGSMPGDLSLRRGEYYANTQNRFWSVMEDVLGVSRAAPYQHRIEGLVSAGVALWDVLKYCRRIGSLDRSIDVSTEVPNDFTELFGDHPGVTRVVFNGKKAAQSFRKLVVPTLNPEVRARLAMFDAPSTSPAHTRISSRALADAWREGLR